MNDDSRAPSPLLASVLRRVGNLADKDTRAGRLFARAESSLTKATERLNHSPSWLKFNGEVLRQRTSLRVRRRSLTEGALRVLRLPTSSEMNELQEHVRHLEEQVGVLGSQLEVAIELLERRGPSASAAPSPPGEGVETKATPAPRPERPRA